MNTQNEYIYRINKVIDYIEINISSELSLEKLSGIANFSPFHFHRIFKGITNETLNNFIKRKRIEKAGSILITEKDKPISDIAFHCGYNSLSVFCRNFKDYFKINAQEFRDRWETEISNNRQLKSKIDKLKKWSDEYICNDELIIKWKNIMKQNIEIKEMPAMNLIYCSHTGEFAEIGKAYEKLMRWAGPKGLLNKEVNTVTVYHDDPKITDISKLRQSACITVDENIKGEGAFGNLYVPKLKCAVGRFEISETEFENAWDAVCLWLSQSGYLPAPDSFPYEKYYNNYMEHPEKKFILDICIPVK